MVRLKGLLFIWVTMPRLLFQFQNGAIKRANGELSQVKKIMFQFQNGAIKSIQALKIPAWLPMFQFQNGAIKSILKKKLEEIEGVFQFQNGAIKSFWFSNTLPFDKTGFNSKMVRLKGNRDRRRSFRNGVSIPKWCD